MDGPATETQQGSVGSFVAAPARVLGGIDCACIVIGAIIGVGIFFTPSKIAALTDGPDAAMLAWAIGGAIALCGALSFADLGGRYHSSGAQYEILRDAYGPMPAFLFVFCNATAVQPGAIGIIAVICGENLAVAAGVRLEGGGLVLAVATALVFLVTLANIVGVKWGSRIQNLTVYAKVLTLLAVTGIAVFAGSRAGVLDAADGGAAAIEATKQGAPRGWVGVLSALTPALFAYGGWQHALWISGEVKDARKTLPRAIIGGVVLVVTVYLLANWAYLHLLGHAGVAASKTLAADAVAVVFPDWGRRAIAAAVALSSFGVLNAQLLSGPRLIYGMATDGRFFKVFGRLSAKFATPVAAILLLTITALVLLFAAGGKDAVDRLISGVVFVDTVFFALTGLALLVFRRRANRARDRARGDSVKNESVPAIDPGLRKAPDPASQSEGKVPGFRVPGYPVVPLLFVVAEIGVLIGAAADPGARVSILIAGGWILVAGALYAAVFRRRGMV